MSDLTEFVLARIAEEEQLASVTSVPNDVATAIAPGVLVWHNFGHVVNIGNFVKASTRPGLWAQRDPKHLLAECAAKRAIVQTYSAFQAAANVESSSIDATLVSRGAVVGLGIALRSIASVYDTHPDFNQEWRTL